MVSPVAGTSSGFFPTSLPLPLASARSDASTPARSRAAPTPVVKATWPDGDRSDRESLARGVPDHRALELPEQLLADASAPTRPRSDRAVSHRVDRAGRACLVRPLDRRVRGVP